MINGSAYLDLGTSTKRKETKKQSYLTIKEGEEVKRTDNSLINEIILSYTKDSFNKVILIKDR